MQLAKSANHIQSLDTLTPDNFRFRGVKLATAKAALKKVFEGTGMLIGAGLPVVINTAVNRGNITTLHDMHEFVQGLGVASWRLGFPKRAGFFRRAYRSLEASWDELLSASFNLLRHHLECGNPLHIQAEPTPRSWEEISEHRKTTMPARPFSISSTKSCRICATKELPSSAKCPYSSD